MTDYLIIYVHPFSHIITHDVEKDYRRAIIRSKNLKTKKRNKYHDVVIVERTHTESGEVKYLLKKYGYGNVYYIINKILLTLVFLFIVFMAYLYIHYIIKN